MKRNVLLLAAFSLFFLGACSDDDDSGDNNTTGSLSTIQGYVNGDNLDKTTTINYDGMERIGSINEVQGSFSSFTYTANYEGNQIATINQDGNGPSVEYQVTYQGNEIKLEPTGQDGNKITFGTTGDYVDNFKVYLNADETSYYEAIFIRDSNNNIDTLTYYATTDTESNVFVYQYTFSDFSSTVALNNAFNPVMNYAFGFYQPLLGAVLNLKISDEVPQTSSYRDGNGSFNEEHVTAQIIADDNGKPTELNYQLVTIPANDYRLEFNYE